MEQRRHLRQSLKVPAQFVSKELGRQSCQLQDFCAEGALVAFEGLSSGRTLQKTLRGDVVLLHVRLPVGGREQVFEIRARVAHVGDNVIGVSFHNPPVAALEALEESAEPAATSSEPTPEVRSTMTDLGGIASEFALRSLRDFFTAMEERFYQAADSAKTDSEQRTFWDALTEFKKHTGGLRTQYGRYLHPVLETFLPPGNKPDEARKARVDKLSLIDKQEFEDWLLIKVMVSRAESNFREPLFELQLRLDELMQKAAGKQFNPFSPQILCDAFKFSLQGFALASADVERMLYKTFEETVLSGLGDLYQRLNAEMVRHGVLPDLDLARYVPPRQSAGGSSAQDGDFFADEQSIGEVVEPAAAPGAHQPARGMHTNPFLARAGIQADGRSARAGLGGYPAHGGGYATASMSDGPYAYPSGALGLRSAEAFCAHAGDSVRAINERFHVQQQIARQAYETARKLIDLQNRPQHNDAVADVAAVEDRAPVRGSETAIPVDTLISGLTRLQHSAPESRPLAERVATVAEAGGRRISDQDSASFRMVEALFATMLANETLSDAIKPWLKMLEIPMLKLVLLDEDLFQSDDHPARLVLNRLARLGLKGQVVTPEQNDAVASVVNKVVTGFDRDPGIFAEVLPLLDRLIEKQEQAYQRNLQRVAQIAESEQKRELASKTVQQSLDDRLSGQVVPKALISLLEAGWRDLLSMVYVRSSDTSPEWKEYWHVVDELLSVGRDVKHQVDLRSLLKSIKTGLDLVGGGMTSDAQQQAVAELKQLLSGHHHLLNEPLPVIKVPEKVVESVSEESQKALQKWIDRARKLVIGNWVEMRREGHESDRLRLAWIGVDHSKFVFVNHQGMKVTDYSLLQLAQLMQDGLAMMVEEFDLPLVDKALDNMVQKIYDQLAWQGTHDELTGLVNRKEFERLIDRALDRSRRMRERHVLVHLDLDQFKLVNNAAGYEAGDRLLKEISVLLCKVPHLPLTVARIGADEFGLLLENCDLTQGHQRMLELMQEISAYRFVDKERPFQLTACVGMVDINFESGSFDTLVKSADSACAIAKETPGGNRLQVWQPDDQEMARRDGVMAWVSRLNQALEEERLQLRCQRIAPISPDAIEHDGPHYEILLSMTDESGLMVSPSEFMQAAERYNRMQAVDRWVIDNVFKWMQENPQKVADMGGYSINLSGHSLNDENLLEYIFEKFATYKVPREKVCFEVTESTAIANLGDAADFIREMKKIGCRFSLDDFGAGLSSYSYLKNLPVDYIKIDGAFIRDLAKDDKDFAMVKSINEMGHLLGKKTIAEYVEDQFILDKLKEIGVDFAQGYEIERPRLLNSM